MLWDLQMDRQIQADQLGIAKIDKEQEAAVRTQRRTWRRAGAWRTKWRECEQERTKWTKILPVVVLWEVCSSRSQDKHLSSPSSGVQRQDLLRHKPSNSQVEDQRLRKLHTTLITVSLYFLYYHYFVLMQIMNKRHHWSLYNDNEVLAGGCGTTSKNKHNHISSSFFLRKPTSRNQKLFILYISIYDHLQSIQGPGLFPSPFSFMSMLLLLTIL